MIMVMTLTTGAIFVMWLGEQITERGIGNGMSMLITVSILEGVWPGAVQLISFVKDRHRQPDWRRVPGRHDCRIDGGGDAVSPWPRGASRSRFRAR